MSLSEKMSRWNDLREEVDLLEFEFETEVIENRDSPWMLALEEIIGHGEFSFLDYFPVGEEILLKLDSPPFIDQGISWEHIRIPITSIEDITVEDALDCLMEQLESHVRQEIARLADREEHIQWVLDEMIATKQYKRLAYYRIMREDDYDGN